MTSNETQRSEHNYRRDSFSDRICDDLSEVILQFLSLKDKLRLECVSKQFQRTVFVKQDYLDYDFCFENEEQLKDFERLLQKIPNITKVLTTEPSYLTDERVYDHKAFDLILKYCPKITHLDTDAVDLFPNEVTQRFIDKYCSQLVSLKLYSGFGYGSDSLDIKWQTMANIEELVVPYLTPELSAVKFDGLKSFEIFETELNDTLSEDMDQLEAFIELNANTIKELYLDTDYSDDEEIKVKNIKRILSIATKVPKLVYFGLNSNFPLNDKRFTHELSQLALKCNQLKGLKINFDLVRNKHHSVEDLLTPLKQFKGLKRLGISFVNCVEPIKKSLFSCKAFKGFEELTHLVISFPFREDYRHLDERILTEIDINLPKLQLLNICDEINASQWTVDVLSRLSCLESIELTVRDESVKPLIETQLKNNCKNINKIKFC